MNIIVCPEIKNNLFTIIYVRVNNIPIAAMNLLPYRTIKRIGNTQLINEIKNQFKLFKESNLTLSNWFKINILIGEQRKDPSMGKFMLKPTKFEFEKVLVNINGAMVPVYMLMVPYVNGTMVPVYMFTQDRQF